MRTKKGKKQQGEEASQDAADESRTVRYVVARPYSAGEMPDVVTATVTKAHDGDPDTLDLAYEAEGEAVKVKAVRRSEQRHEPGTWHEGGE